MKTPPHWQTPATIDFYNASSQSINIYWIYPDGSLIPYYVLAPSQTLPQATYVNNAWEVTDTNGNCLAKFVATGTTATATVTGP